MSFHRVLSDGRLSIGTKVELISERTEDEDGELFKNTLNFSPKIVGENHHLRTASVCNIFIGSGPHEGQIQVCDFYDSVGEIPVELFADESVSIHFTTRIMLIPTDRVELILDTDTTTIYDPFIFLRVPEKEAHNVFS